MVDNLALALNDKTYGIDIVNLIKAKPAKGRNGKIDGGKMNVKLPALSWNVIRLIQNS